MLTKLYETIKQYLQQEENVGITVTKTEDGLCFCFKEDGSTHEIFKNEIPVTALIDLGVSAVKDLLHAVEKMHEKAVKMSALIQTPEEWKKHLFLRTVSERPTGVLYRKETEQLYSYLCLKMQDENESDYCAVSTEILQYWWAKEKSLEPADLWKNAQENVWKEAIIQAEVLSGFPVQRKYRPILADGVLNWETADSLRNVCDSLLIRVKHADAAYVTLAYSEIAKYFSYLFGKDFKVVLLGENRVCVCRNNCNLSAEDIALWNSLVGTNVDDFCYNDTYLGYDSETGKYCHLSTEGDVEGDDTEGKSQWTEL